MIVAHLFLFYLKFFFVLFWSPADSTIMQAIPYCLTFSSGYHWVLINTLWIYLNHNSLAWIFIKGRATSFDSAAEECYFDTHILMKCHINLVLRRNALKSDIIYVVVNNMFSLLLFSYRKLILVKASTFLVIYSSTLLLLIHHQKMCWCLLVLSYSKRESIQSLAPQTT